MKAICVKKRDWSNLTIGKTYNVIRVDCEDDVDYYGIIDDGYKVWYEKEYFKPLSEIRNERIDKLLENESSM